LLRLHRGAVNSQEEGHNENHGSKSDASVPQPEIHNPKSATWEQGYSPIRKRPSKGKGNSSFNLNRVRAERRFARTTSMSPQYSHRIWRQAPHGGVSSSVSARTTIRLNSDSPSDSAFQAATRSAQTVKPYVEFSTLQPP